jgi:hypothetical protein
MLCVVDAEPSEVVGPWEIWCPHYWVREGALRLIEIGTEFNTPVGSTSTRTGALDLLGRRPLAGLGAAGTPLTLPRS